MQTVEGCTSQPGSTDPHEDTVRVSLSDLPVCCPTADAPLWRMHPRVFLPLSPENPALPCPYCGRLFTLNAPDN